MFGFGKRKREIFKYHDGLRTRFADPIVIMRSMSMHPKLDLEEHLKQFASEQTELRNEAAVILTEATRDIFGITPFSDRLLKGLTELETLDVLNSFIDYLDTLKKNGNGPPT